MTTVGTYEAKTHLADLLKQVASGQKIVITRRGKPIAMLVPPPKEEDQIQTTFKEMIARRDREGPNLGGTKLRDLLDEGRR